MDSIRELVHQATSVNSIWSIVLRGLIWLVISLIIIISMDHPNTDLANKKLKANLGFFLIFMVLSGGLVYLLFGFAQS
jgi:uncharacterized integral membrane protein